MHPPNSEPWLPIYDSAEGEARYRRDLQTWRAGLEAKLGLCIGKRCRIQLKSLDHPLEGLLLIHESQQRLQISGINTTFHANEIESYTRLE